MNKQALKFQTKEDIARLQNSVFRVIAAFPPENNWHMGHVRVAVNKLVENPELSTEQVIKLIKRSYLCADEGWFVDKGIKSDPCPSCTNWINKLCISNGNCINRYAEGKNPEYFIQRMCGNCGNHHSNTNACDGNSGYYFTAQNRHVIPSQNCWIPKS